MWSRIAKICDPHKFGSIAQKEFLKNFANLRPISLSCFINKMISRVLHDRMVEVLPRIISPNQSKFMNRRNIIENVLLAQEIIKDIGKRKKHTNVMVKLDMAKAYDRVSWIFLTKVLRNFGFDERVIDMMWRLLSNNWYSVPINV